MESLKSTDITIEVVETSLNSTSSLTPPASKESPPSDHPHYLRPKSFSKANKTEWQRAGRQTLIGAGQFAIWIALAVAYIIVYIKTNSPSCIDDTFSAFSIDSVTGSSYTLGEARFIDISFKVVAGRGLQAVTGFVSYRVITDSLLRMMERTPVSFELFSALTFQLHDLHTIWPILKSIVSLPGIRSKFIMGWILFSAVILIILPTLFDAMTGYTHVQDYYMPSQGGDEGLVLVSVNSSNWNEVKCYPSQSGRYQWGFSSTWVFITWSCLGVWMLGTYSVWMDAQHNSELRRKGRTMNPYRAVKDMADAMTEELGPNMAPYSGQELEKAVKESKKCIMYAAEVNQESGLGKIRLSTAKNEPMGKLDFELEYGEER